MSSSLLANSESATPEELTRMYYTYGSELDYESLVEHMHPYTLSKFKEISLDIIQSLAGKESLEIVNGSTEDGDSKIIIFLTFVRNFFLCEHGIEFLSVITLI